MRFYGLGSSLLVIDRKGSAPKFLTLVYDYMGQLNIEAEEWLPIAVMINPKKRKIRMPNPDPFAYERSNVKIQRYRSCCCC